MMLSREQLVAKLQRLKDHARKAAKKNGHELDPFARFGTSAFANCVKCGSWARVQLFPQVPGQTETGTALSAICRKKD